MTTPTTLPKEGTTAIWHSTSSAYGGPFTYRYNSANSTTDYAVYALHYDDTEPDQQNIQQIPIDSFRTTHNPLRRKR